MLWVHVEGGRTADLDAVTKAGALEAHATRVYRAVLKKAIQLPG